MRIGLPKEIKPMEGRVALSPTAVGELAAAGHQLLVQRGAGQASGYEDAEYANAGATMVSDAESVWQADLVVKVKEPVAAEYGYLRQELTLFSYLHLAANPVLADKLVQSGVTSIGFETVDVGGTRPLLAPMSDIAGRLSVQYGATLLHSPAGGKGKLLGGVAGADRGRVVVLGTGVAGAAATRVAANLGAEVTVFGLQRGQLDAMHQLGPNVTALPSEAGLRQEAIEQADLLVGAVLVPGDRAPWLVSREQVASMGKGSVIVDISVDQGGCIETTRATDYTAPTYVEEGVIHFAVTNMPGAVPATASQALSAAISPFVQRLAGLDVVTDDPALAAGMNTRAGRIVHEAVAHALRS